MYIYVYVYTYYEVRKMEKKIEVLIGGSGKYYAELPSGIISGKSSVMRRYARRGDNKEEVIAFLKKMIQNPKDEGIRLRGGYIFEFEEGEK